MATAMQGAGLRAGTSPTTGMGWKRVERLAPLTGIVSALLGAGGLIVLEGVADRPDADSDPGAFLTYFRDDTTVILGSLLLLLSVAAYLCYVGVLHAALRRAEGGAGRLSSIAYGGGLVTGALLLALPGVSVLGALWADHLTLVEAKTLFAVGDVFLYPAAITASVLVAGTALAALRTELLPRWLVWLSLALALWLIIPPLGPTGTPGNPALWSGLAAIAAVPAWIALTAVVMLLRPSREA